MRLQIFEVLEDLRGVEDFQIAMDQDRHLLLRIDPNHFRVLGLVTGFERNHDQLEVQAFLQDRDLGLRPEHAERPREQA
jgi:hypothetical protein